ncbi:hypothetical protein JRI60_36105 [Archangium violaceum]|uniref:hypothetical protein n=1 Tax=Archangium violaceum TaxID=83451 RepID=UPI0019502DDB|nr:hypothetical protein [Archangium violaceum]QRN94514.1 hypothetical protein JRI60_36105 [Archangium violaceum]
MPLNTDKLLSFRGRLARLLLASTLLGACATGPGRFGAPPRRDLRLDTESAARVRHASMLGTSGTSAAPLAVGAALVVATPLVMSVLHHDAEKARELQERLTECARLAEHRVNSSHFGNRPPTREECGEEMDVDGCGEPITRAMLLGRQKHDIALACAREVLSQLWPAPFSIEQRYRFYRTSQILETISREQEQQFIKEGCTDRLKGTIKPDIVLHADYNNLLQAALVLDFKFPCPPSNRSRWTDYGPRGAFPGANQGQIYKEALGAEVFRLTPQGIY